MTTFQYFIKNPIRKLLVNDKPVENWVGTKTEGGHYKNGYIASLLEGKKDKYSYIQLNIYTSAGCVVDIEEKWLIRSDDKIMKRLGWNNVDLLRISRKGECERDIKILMGKWSMWKEYDEEECYCALDSCISCQVIMRDAEEKNK